MIYLLQVHIMTVQTEPSKNIYIFASKNMRTAKTIYYFSNNVFLDVKT